MATRITTLFSLDAVKAYLPASSDAHDRIIEQIADGVSARIESITGRKFVTRSVTHTTDARGDTKVKLPDYPIVSITTVKRRSDLSESFSAAMDSTAYEADLKLGILYLKTESFYCGPLTTEVVYSAGYGAQDAATLPLYQEALDYVKFVYSRQANGVLMASSLSNGAGSVIVVPEPPKDIRDAILAWRKVRI